MFRYFAERVYIFVLKACAFRKDYFEGGSVHARAEKLGFLESDVRAQNRLVNFYVGCGKIKLAREVFDCIEVKTIVSWNSMMRFGELEEVSFYLFSAVRVKGWSLMGIL